MTDRNRPDAWLSLPDLRAKCAHSRWRYSPLMEQVSAAVKMQMAPSAFFALPESDQAMLIAFFRVQAAITGFEESLREREAAGRNHGNRQWLPKR